MNDKSNGTETRYYPFETDHLEKGSHVPAETIERAYGISRNDPKYGIKAFLPARHHVERSFAERGEIVTVVERKGDLVILTDEEASYHNVNARDQYIKRAGQSHVRLCGVDRAKLPSSRLSEHDREIVVGGRALQAAGKILGFRAFSRERTTPELPSGDE